MIFNINFFLFSFAQSCIVSYSFLFAKHYANVTSAQYSVFALVLPAITFFAKPISCSIADANGIHKQFLIGAYCVFLTGYGSLGLVAFLKDPENHDNDTLAWMVISLCMAFGYTAMSCAFCMNDALASNYARKNNKSYSRMRIWSNVGWASGPLLIILIGNIAWLPFRVPGILILIATSVVMILFLCLWPYDEDFEMFHDGTTVEQRKLSIVGPNTMAYLAQNKPRGSISRDMLERIKSGRSKSVGNLPRMTGQLKPLDLTSPIGDKNQDDNESSSEQELKEYSNFHCQLILIKMIASGHKSFLRYIFLFTLFGMIQGIIFTYEFDYIKFNISKDDNQFETISSVCMIAQSFLGEIPINMFATDLIRIFGANANMSLALVTIGLRCFFYSQMLPYLGPLSVMIAEALQGPSLGLYWILIVDVGSNYALMVTDYMPEMKRKGYVRSHIQEEELNGCLRASMIGMMSSSMEGLGVAMGAFLGGLLSDSLDYTFMWNTCAIVGISLGLINITWDVSKKLVFNRQSKKNSKSKKVDQSSLKIPAVVIDDASKL